ncbi:MAG: AI-2E family transporter [Roseburia sp.]|nr:AI-2E family transporter [Roseburia sp.]
MEISRETKKHLMQIIAFAIILYCGVQNLGAVVTAVRFVLSLLMPFMIGGAIAFVLNVPMKKIEKHLFPKNQKMTKLRRPVAYVLTLACVIGIIVLAVGVIFPELGNTVSLLAAQIPKAFDNLSKWLATIPEEYPALAPAIADLNIDWSSISKTAVDVVQSVGTGLFDSGVGFFSGIISGVTTFVVAFVFSIYVLLQKEKLGRQIRQIMYALLPDKVTEKFFEVVSLSGQIFSSFLSGQCLEAVILGTMFVIALSIFRMPYALLIGVTIAITALVPIFGAFIGCAVGALLIVMVDPIQALWFVVLFLVLQQVEGNLIYPHVVGSSVGLPSIWVLAAVTLGADLFGIGGILVFIPLCSVIYSLFRKFVKERLKERGIEIAETGTVVDKITAADDDKVE